MAASNKANGNSDGSKRAAEFQDAMLGLPGYGDDSIFFIVRYVNTAKQSLRECDFEEFMGKFAQLNKLWDESQQEGAEGAEGRYEKAQELKQQALDKIQDYPNLVRDFDRLLSNGRSVAKLFGNMENK